MRMGQKIRVRRMSRERSRLERPSSLEIKQSRGFDAAISDSLALHL
jgi:hypothetical protein